MKPLMRPTPQPKPPRTKILLVRRAAGVKSVRHRDEPDRTALRLAIGVIVAIGVVVVVWLMGYLGFRLGFAPLLDVPHLQIDLGGGLITGTIMLISIPRVIILAGVEKPAWLMLGFLLIAIPAAGLSAVKPRTPGGPHPSLAAVTFSYAGAVLAAVHALIMIGWAASDLRSSTFAGLPFHPGDAEAWFTSLRTVAGMDALAVIASAVWVVLIMRLAIPNWLRAIAATASFFALVVVTVAMSMSGAAVAQLQSARSEVFLDDGSIETRLVLGNTPSYVATLRVDQGGAVVELHDRAIMMTVIGRKSIVSRLEEANERRQAEDRR